MRKHAPTHQFALLVEAIAEDHPKPAALMREYNDARLELPANSWRIYWINRAPTS